MTVAVVAWLVGSSATTGTDDGESLLTRLVVPRRRDGDGGDEDDDRPGCWHHDGGLFLRDGSPSTPRACGVLRRRARGEAAATLRATVGGSPSSSSSSSSHPFRARGGPGFSLGRASPLGRRRRRRQPQELRLHFLRRDRHGRGAQWWWRRHQQSSATHGISGQTQEEEYEERPRRRRCCRHCDARHIQWGPSKDGDRYDGQQQQ